MTNIGKGIRIYSIVGIRSGRSGGKCISVPQCLGPQLGNFDSRGLKSSGDIFTLMLGTRCRCWWGSQPGLLGVDMWLRTGSDMPRFLIQTSQAWSFLLSIYQMNGEDFKDLEEGRTLRWEKSGSLNDRIEQRPHHPTSDGDMNEKYLSIKFSHLHLEMFVPAANVTHPN